MTLKSCRPGMELSAQELGTVLMLCADDEPTIRMVATRQHISPHTAGTYVKRAYRKLGVQTRVGAFKALLRAGLVPDMWVVTPVPYPGHPEGDSNGAA